MAVLIVVVAVLTVAVVVSAIIKILVCNLCSQIFSNCHFNPDNVGTV